MKDKKYTGINIQWPISQLIIAGDKTIETRTYPIPKKYLNQEMLLIETPGKMGNFRARIVAIIKFTDCFQYRSSAEFYADSKLHSVTKDSPWAWNSKGKWGWKVEVIKKLDNEIPAPTEKGIVYTQSISLKLKTAY